MSVDAGQLITTVLRRLRDPNGLATSRAFVLDTLSRLQQLLNAHLKTVRASYQVNTEANRLLYPVFSIVPNIVEVERVRDFNATVDLDVALNWHNFTNIKKAWFRDAANQSENWFMIGRDLIVIHPAKPQPSTLEIGGTKLTTRLAAEVDETEVRDEDLVPLLDLVELLISVKSRRLERAGTLVQQLASSLNLTIPKVASTGGAAPTGNT